MRYSNLFWFAAFFTATWNGWMFIQFTVGAFYHPMSAKGDMLRLVKEVALLAPVPIAVVVFLIWLWRRPLAERTYLIGLVLLLVAILLPFLPRIEGNYREAYWLGDTQHEIPWYYGPYNGSNEPGGKLFWVSVSFPELEPRYRTRSRLITIGKSVDFNNGEGGDAQGEPCTKYQTYIKCEWRRGDFVYMTVNHPELFPSDVSKFKVSVVDLLDSFEVREPE
ncbi:MAG: hypothetical protein AAFY05_16605 [Pseudomonadota bacterium]